MTFKVGDVVEAQAPSWDTWAVGYCVVLRSHANGNVFLEDLHATEAKRMKWWWNERTSDERLRRMIQTFWGLVPCPSR